MEKKSRISWKKARKTKKSCQRYVAHIIIRTNAHTQREEKMRKTSVEFKIKDAQEELGR